MSVCTCVNVCVYVCVTSFLLCLGQRLHCGLRLFRLLSLLFGSSSECDVQGNGLRATELVISSAPIRAVKAAAGAVITVPIITMSATPDVIKCFFCFAIIISAEHGCSSSFGIFNAVSLREVSGTNNFTVTHAAACFVRLVWKQGAAPDGQVRVGPLHLHDRLVYTGKVVMLRLGRGVCYKLGVPVEYLEK